MLTTAIATVPMDVFDTVDGLVNRTQATIGGVIGLAGVIIGLLIAVKARSVTGVIVGIVVGGLIAALGGLVLWASGVFDDTLTAPTPAAAGTSAVMNEQVINHQVIDPRGVTVYQS